MSDDRIGSDGRLPPINSKILPNGRGRGSSFQLHNIEEERLSSQLIPLDDLTDINKYDDMTEKELIKEHELLVRRLLKYRQLIDIILFKSPRPKKESKQPVDSMQLLKKEMQNNNKIISNHLNEIKEIQRVKQHRSIEQVMEEQHATQQSISKLKKQIFDLKNQDVMNTKNLLTDKAYFEKERAQLDMTYKLELKRSSDYKKKFEELQSQMDSLKKVVGQPPKSPNTKRKMRAMEKKEYLDLLRSQMHNKQQLTEQCFLAKTRRNQGILKDTEVVDRKCRQLQKQIEQFQNRNDRYWKRES